MIVDVILDRKEHEALLASGYTHRQYPNGELKSNLYDPHEFYMYIMQYGGEWAEQITRAMDSGSEQDVKDALCAYITGCDYNPDICDFVRSRNWLTPDVLTSNEEVA